jgi:hypothetical protein
MQRIGLHLNPDGYWTRTDSPARRQLRLFPGRPGRPQSARSDLRGSGKRARSRLGRLSVPERLPGVVWDELEAAS